MFKLLIADDEGKTTVVPLVRDEVTIGRKEGNTIRLTDRNVSRRHAKLVRRDGGFIVEDLDSYNGVRLNGVPVLNPKPVSDGDRLTIGDYQLSLRSDRPAPAMAPRPAPVEPPPYPRLVMLGPPDPGKEFALAEAEVIIGRTDENAVVINHRSISRSHAKIVVQNNICRLYDLDSANGVRVNGEDYKEVELRRGDLVELGTVRLRFVGAGEFYQFDADATVQIDALPESLSERRSPLVLIIVGIVAVAVIAVVGVVFLTMGPTNRGPQVAPAPTHPMPPAPVGPAAADVKAQARDLIKRELYDAALAALDSLGPSVDEEARQLRTRALAEKEALQLWQAACVEADPGDVELVHRGCQRIEASSFYRKRGCCREAAERAGGVRVEKALALFLRRDFEDALAVAAAVADDRSMPEGVRADAQGLVEKARTRLEAAAGRPPHEPGTSPGKVTPPRPPPPRPPPPTKSEQVPAAEALMEARGCVLRNDQQCCIKALQGAQRTEQVVTLLMSCYQKAGRLDAACSLARRYPRCGQCQQFAQQRCQ
jgi:pSer/pThr/pTyr-binding forkhead associated (FHA) protein